MTDISVIPTKTKKDLKDIFGKADALYYCSTQIDFSNASSEGLEFTPEYDFPCLIDTLSVSMSDPNLTHVKVIGINGDWYMDAEAGDSTVEFTVPTKATDILKVAFGEEAVKQYSVKVGSATLTGDGLTLKTNKVTGVWAILNKEHNQLMLLNGLQLYATPNYGGSDNAVVSVKFSGSMSCNGVDPDMLWLKAE